MTPNTETETKISNDLIRAYKGRYKDDYNPITCVRIVGEMSTEDAIEIIKKHSPKERLDVYLTWIGVLGYTSRIFKIATGEL